jgi:hypothetical protein
MTTVESMPLLENETGKYMRVEKIWGRRKGDRGKKGDTRNL